jgi:hypothetical protein
MSSQSRFAPKTVRTPGRSSRRLVASQPFVDLGEQSMWSAHEEAETNADENGAAEFLVTPSLPNQFLRASVK